MLSQVCKEFLGMTLEELDEKRPLLAGLLRSKFHEVGERHIKKSYQTKTFLLHAELNRIDSTVSLLEFASDTGDWPAIGFHKARLLDALMSTEANYCLMASSRDIYDMPCMTCTKHKRIAYLDLTIPMTLKMISWLNVALKELSTMKEYSVRRENLKLMIEAVESELFAEFACLKTFIAYCAKIQCIETELAIIAYN